MNDNLWDKVCGLGIDPVASLLILNGLFMAFINSPMFLSRFSIIESLQKMPCFLV